MGRSPIGRFRERDFRLREWQVQRSWGDYRLNLFKGQQEVQHGWSELGKVENLGKIVKDLTITYHLARIWRFVMVRGVISRVIRGNAQSEMRIELERSARPIDSKFSAPPTILQAQCAVITSLAPSDFHSSLLELQSDGLCISF